MATGTVIASGPYSVMILNDLGGSRFLPPGSYRVRALPKWSDYEIGDRMSGDLIDPDQVEIARDVGTTPYEPKLDFHPQRVYFAGSDFVPDPEDPDALPRRITIEVEQNAQGVDDYSAQVFVDEDEASLSYSEGTLSAVLNSIRSDLGGGDV